MLQHNISLYANHAFRAMLLPAGSELDTCIPRLWMNKEHPMLGSAIIGQSRSSSSMSRGPKEGPCTAVSLKQIWYLLLGVNDVGQALVTRRVFVSL